VRLSISFRGRRRHAKTHNTPGVHQPPSGLLQIRPLTAADQFHQYEVSAGDDEPHHTQLMPPLAVSIGRLFDRATVRLRLHQQ